MINWFYLTLAIFCEVLATSTLKSTDSFTRLIPSLLVVSGYGGAFYFISLTLSSIPIGVAYAVWSGIGIVLISILDWLLYDQKLNYTCMLGMFFIIVGVVILNIFSQSTNH